MVAAGDGGCQSANGEAPLPRRMKLAVSLNMSYDYDIAVAESNTKPTLLEKEYAHFHEFFYDANVYPKKKPSSPT